MASRQNYDVGQESMPGSTAIGVFEFSWRVDGATSTEVSLDDVEGDAPAAPYRRLALRSDRILVDPATPLRSGRAGPGLVGLERIAAFDNAVITAQTLRVCRIAWRLHHQAYRAAPTERERCRTGFHRTIIACGGTFVPDSCSLPTTTSRYPVRRANTEETMHSLIYLVGLIVVVLFILSFFGLR